MNKLQILKLLKKYETEVSCPKKQVAAILVRQNLEADWILEGHHDLLRIGTNCRLLPYNDFRCDKCVDGYKGFTCPAIHAEADCLIGLPFTETQHSTLLISWSPCPECCKLINRAGIDKVIIREPRLKLISKADSKFYDGAKTYDELAEKLLYSTTYVRLWELDDTEEVAI